MLNRRVAILNGHFKKAVAEPEPYVLFGRHPDKIDTFYVLIRNIAGPFDMFKGAEFLFEMATPNEFPHKPPTFKALTPNGVYELGKTCCISIGQYHPENYRAVSGIREFPIELANGFIGCTCECTNKCDCTTLDKSGGINLIKCTKEQRMKYAAQSKEYNEKHNKEIITDIEQQYFMYTSQWTEHMEKMSDEEKRKYNFRSVIFVEEKKEKGEETKITNSAEPAKAPNSTEPTKTPNSTEPTKTAEPIQAEPQKRKISIKIKKGK